MSSLLRQLSQLTSDSTVNKCVIGEYEARDERARQFSSPLSKLTVEDCTILLLELTRNNPAIIMIDALDDVEESTRHKILEAIDTLVSSSEGRVKVLISSRDDLDVVSIITIW